MSTMTRTTALEFDDTVVYNHDGPGGAERTDGGICSDKTAHTFVRLFHRIRPAMKPSCRRGFQGAARRGSACHHHGAGPEAMDRLAGREKIEVRWCAREIVELIAAAARLL